MIRLSRLGRRLRLLAVVVAAAGAALAAVAPPAGAAANDQFSVEPFAPDTTSQRPWFAYSFDPGQIHQDIVTVQNLSDEPLRLVLYPSDGVIVPGGGGFAPLREDEVPTDAGTWITLPVDEITLDPMEGANIPFEIEVPAEAEPGDHAAVIVASDPEGSVGEADGDLQVSVRNRIGTRIYIRVAGPLDPSLRVDAIEVDHNRPLNPFADGSATITYSVTNTGNVRLDEDIQLDINGAFGRNIESLPPRSFPDVLPGGVIVVTEEVSGLPAWEPLSAQVSATSPQASTSRTTTFYAVPWPTVVLLLLAAALLGLWLWRRRRSRAVGTDAADDSSNDESGGTKPALADA